MREINSNNNNMLETNKKVGKKPQIKNGDYIFLKSLMNEITTLQIYHSDLKNIKNRKTLEKYKWDLEVHIETLNKCLDSFNERIDEMELKKYK
jgi:hypothetical protein